MPNTRRQCIQVAFEALKKDETGFVFQRLGCRLLGRLYPNINPMPIKKDLGQDATASALIPVRHDDRNYSFAFSLTPTLQKLKDDCHRCKEMGHSFDVLVFTVCGEVMASNRKDWSQYVSDTYGWSLIIHDMNFLLNEAELKENDDLIADELNIKRPEIFTFTENVGGQASLMIDNLSRQTRLHMYNRDDFDHLVRNSIDLAIQQRTDWKFDDAINTLETSLSKFSETLSKSDISRIYANIAVNYHDIGDINTSNKYIKLAIEYNSDNINIYLNKIICLLDSGDYDGAESILEETERRFGPNADIHNLYGCIYHNQGKDQEALRRLDEAIALDATHVEAFINKGLSIRRSGDLDNALKIFKEACALDADSYTAHAFRLETQAHMVMERSLIIDPALLIVEINFYIDRLVNGKRHPPKSHNIAISIFYSALGIVHQITEEFTVAVEAFRIALNYQDNNVIHVNLGMSLMRLGDRQAAEDEFRIAVDDGCLMPNVLYNIAIYDIAHYLENKCKC
ncbi:MAG: tetratricopeptide repeat protein [Armatimonadota bacterium]